MSEVSRRNFLGLFLKGTVGAGMVAVFPKAIIGSVLATGAKAVETFVDAGAKAGELSNDECQLEGPCDAEAPLYKFKYWLEDIGRKTTSDILKERLSGSSLETLANMAEKFNKHFKWSRVMDEIVESRNQLKWDRQEKELQDQEAKLLAFEPPYGGEV